MLLVGGSRKFVSDSAQPDAKDQTVAVTTTPSCPGSESLFAGPHCTIADISGPVPAACRPLQTKPTPENGISGIWLFVSLFAADGVACSRLLAMYCAVWGWNTGRASPFARIAR